MPNICEYEFMFKGTKKNVQTLLNWMNSEYNYDGWKSEVYLLKGEKKIPQKHHIGYRVFDCYYDSFEDDLAKANDNDVLVVGGFGNVAWSCACTMFDLPLSYMSYDSISLCLRSKSFNIKKLFRRIQRKLTSKSISLPKACEKLHIEAEIWSREPGMCFAEHYYIKNGEVLVEESTEYQEIYIDEYSSYEEYIKDMKENYPNDKKALSVTKEQFDNADGYIVFCDWLVNDEFEYQYVC